MFGWLMKMAGSRPPCDDPATLAPPPASHEDIMTPKEFDDAVKLGRTLELARKIYDEIDHEIVPLAEDVEAIVEVLSEAIERERSRANLAS